MSGMKWYKMAIIACYAVGILLILLTLLTGNNLTTPTIGFLLLGITLAIVSWRLQPERQA